MVPSTLTTHSLQSNYNFIAKCQYTDCRRNVLWCQVHLPHIHSNQITTLLPSVSTLIAGGMFCGAKYTPAVVRLLCECGGMQMSINYYYNSPVASVEQGFFFFCFLLYFLSCEC